MKLAISGGDPQGIGPHVALRASLVALAENHALDITLFCPRQKIEALGEAFQLDWQNERFHVVDVPFEEEGPAPSRAGGAAARESLDMAVSMIERGEAEALVTAPLSKEAVAASVPGFSGHTEYLAARANASVLMMLANDALRVVLATTHMPLASVPAAITAESLEADLAMVYREMKNRFGIAEPKVAVLGLNPHSGEGGLLGNEEEDVIKPALSQLGGAEAGFFGPFPADTFFLPGRFDQYDVVFAMYHDQGLTPVKILGPETTVNVTLGLPYVRTSPDHGTAFDLPFDVIPSSSSMLEAIRMAAKKSCPKKD